MLELLRRHAAVATFCVVGNQVRKHPELLREIVEAGMRLCNHTSSHPRDLTRGPRRCSAARSWARADIAGAADAPVAYFRAPGGHWSPPCWSWPPEGMQPLGWSVDLRDWERPGPRRSWPRWNRT